MYNCGRLWLDQCRSIYSCTLPAVIYITITSAGNDASPSIRISVIYIKTPSEITKSNLNRCIHPRHVEGE